MTRKKEEEDFQSELVFHRREWVVQRIGWAGIAIFLLLALAGLFGGGPLSHVFVGSSEAGSIEYERYTRRTGRTEIIISPVIKSDKQSRTRIAIPSAYLQAFTVDEITPEPINVRISGERLIYEFATALPASSISFHLKPEELGRHIAQIEIDSAPPLTIRQFTYP